MAKRRLKFKNYLSTLFICFAILSVGTISLIENSAINYYTVLNTLKKMIPAIVVLGGLGWVMGSILDKPKKISGLMPDQLLLDELMKEAGIQDNPTEGLSTENIDADINLDLGSKKGILDENLEPNKI